MKTMYDLQQLLKSYGAIIYTTDRYADLALMEEDLKMLYHAEFIGKEEYISGSLLIKRELGKLQTLEEQ